ncbi:MAG: flagellar assembly protein A [Moorellaceae bacterium]
MEEKRLKIEAETVDEALKRATTLLKVPPEEIEIQVLDEGGGGKFLRLARRPVVVLAWRKAGTGGEMQIEEGAEEKSLKQKAAGEEGTEPDGSGEIRGYAGVEKGKILVKGSTPVTIVGNPHLELYVNGQLLGGEVQVTSEDRIEVKPKENLEEGRWQLQIRDKGLTAVISLRPGKRHTWRLLDQPPSERLELKAKPVEEPLPALTWETLQQALKEHHIVFGLDHRALEEACRRVEPGEIVIARGKPPVPPEDGRIEFLFELSATKRREVGEEERVDYRELVVRSSVVAGELLAVKHSSQPGEPGITVTGEPLPPPPPKEVSLMAGKGTVLSQDGRSCLAAIEGQPRAIIRGSRVIIEVTPVLMHEGDVNLASGNLKFTGSIVIHGSVTESMTVMARRDVEIKGDVAQATVRAGGSIIVRGNVIGSTLVAGDTASLLISLGRLFEDLAADLDQLLQALTQLQEHVQERVPYKEGYLINVLIENKFKKVPDLVCQMEHLCQSIKENEEEKLLQVIQRFCQSFRSPVSRQELAESDLRELLSAAEEMAIYCKAAREEGGHISANYALNSKLHALGNVTIVGRGCFSTEIVAGGNIEIKGVFRAGKLYAEGNVFIQEMGSSGGARTLARVAEGRIIKAGKIWPNSVLQIGKRIRQVDAEEHRVMAYLNSEGNLVLGTF